MKCKLPSAIINVFFINKIIINKKTTPNLYESTCTRITFVRKIIKNEKNIKKYVMYIFIHL